MRRPGAPRGALVCARLCGLLALETGMLFAIGLGRKSRLGLRQTADEESLICAPIGAGSLPSHGLFCGLTSAETAPDQRGLKTMRDVRVAPWVWGRCVFVLFASLSGLGLGDD